MDILLWIAIIVLILLPLSMDPAIRIKMRQVLHGDHPESRGAEWIAYARRRQEDYYIWFLAGSEEGGGFYWVADESQANRYPTGDDALKALNKCEFARDAFKHGAKMADAR